MSERNGADDGLQRQKTASTDNTPSSEDGANQGGPLGGIDRRQYLKLGAATAVGAIGFSGRSTAETRAGISFDRVVDAVDDLGMDPDGDSPIDDALDRGFDDGTLIEFPPGEYLVTRVHEFNSVDNAGMVGKTGDRSDVEFVFPDGYDEQFLNVRFGQGWLFGDFTLQQTDDTATGAGLAFGPNRDCVLRNVEIAGFNPRNKQRGMEFVVYDDDGEATIDRYVRTGGSAVGDYPSGTQALLIPEEHEGTIYIEDAQIENAGENGIYASRGSGDVRIEGGYFANNDIASVRIAGDGSYIKGATFVVDTDSADKTGTYFNTRALWLESGSKGYTGGLVEDCDFTIKNAPNCDGAIRVQTTAGDVTIRNCRFRNETRFPTIYAEEPDRISGDGPVTIENCSITGGASNPRRGAIELEERDGSSISSCCISMDGEQDGVVVRSSSGVTVRRSTIDVNGEALVTPGSNVGTSGLSYSGSCPLPDDDGTGAGGDTGGSEDGSDDDGGSDDSDGSDGSDGSDDGSDGSDGTDDSDGSDGSDDSESDDSESDDSESDDSESDDSESDDSESDDSESDDSESDDSESDDSESDDSESDDSESDDSESDDSESDDSESDDSESDDSESDDSESDDSESDDSESDDSESDDSTEASDGSEESDDTSESESDSDDSSSEASGDGEESSDDGDGDRGGASALSGETRTLRLTADTVSPYEFTVGGDVEFDPGYGTEDRIDGSTVRGVLAGGTDAYRFTGDLTSFTVSGDATVTLDGQRVDTSALGGGSSGSTDDSGSADDSEESSESDSGSDQQSDGESSDESSGSNDGSSDSDDTSSGDESSESSDSTDSSGESDEDVSGGSTDVGLANVIVLESDAEAPYDLEVSGDIAYLPGYGRDDSVTESGANGALAGGADAYLFSGLVTAFDCEGDVSVTVNGESVAAENVVGSGYDGAGDGQSGSKVLSLVGDASDYSFAVDGTAERVPTYGDDDHIDGQVVRGALYGGRDDYRIEGDLLWFDIQGDAEIRLDGEPVDASDLPNQA
ncbi:right-handed parallel beta-helix repeat-containing protein [Halomarina rubra]|uniref:Right-handed parallel beta-helix repeat-containing protein n=1 Tax=Halomarina rubra TaxID=2071873 RepID=A0ABD6AWU5_9EURY|nr:right-handed parallel beta-helix repeat-containing protein [Halomarina rubra]